MRGNPDSEGNKLSQLEEQKKANDYSLYGMGEMDGDLYVCGFEEEKIDEISGEKLIVKCQMKYKQPRGRIVHIKEYHEKIRFVCPVLVCQKIYTRKLEMRKHFYKNHPKLDLEDEQRKFEEQKDSFTQDSYVCTFAPKARDGTSG